MLSLIVNSEEYALPVQDAKLQAALDELYDKGRLSELVNPHAALASVRPDWPSPPETAYPAPRIGVLYWPIVGLAHYAHAAYLVDEVQMAAIRAGITAQGDNGVTVRFRDDPTGLDTPRDIPMRFLGARWLARNDAGDGLDAWVVLLVDDRYRSLHSVVAYSAGAWSGIFAGAGVTVSDAVDGDYLTPSDRWALDGNATTNGRSAAWLADIAALSVGSRIVTTPTGGSVLQRPTAGNKSALTSATAAATADGRHVAGGPLSITDPQIGFPDTANVTFGGRGEPVPVVVTVTGVGGGWPTGTAVSHWCDAPASTESAERSALTAQWADDWEAWQRVPDERIFAGIVAAPASGFLWAVEWTHTGTECFTRFVRPPHWYGYLLAPARGLQPEATDGPYEPPAYDYGETCVTWYTSYLHLAGSAVYVGQTIRPGQYLGVLGPYSNGAHLHFSLGDGDQTQNPVPGSVTAGVAQDIESWITDLGFPITGAHVGVLPSPLANFSAPQLATIEARFAFPLDDTLDWEALISSPFHTGWDYYGLDFLIPADDVEGRPVYAAFRGDDVRTTVTYSGYTAGVGWVIILKHEVGNCETDSGEPGEESIINQVVGNGLTFVQIGGLGNPPRLQVNDGCNITFDGLGALLADTVALAGDSTLTSLVDHDGCAIGVDLETAYTQTVTVQTGVSDTVTCCVGTVTTTSRVLTMNYNAAGLLLSIDIGAATENETTYDACLRVRCCLADVLELSDVIADPDHGFIDVALDETLEVEFLATATGGVAPYTYSWDWDDGSPAGSGDNPTHEFENYGQFLVEVTVTDACGCTATAIVPVHVGEECGCDECEVGQPTEGLEATLVGVPGEYGTGDFATAAGTYTFFNVGGCNYAAYKDGWRGLLTIDPVATGVGFDRVWPEQVSPPAFSFSGLVVVDEAGVPVSDGSCCYYQAPVEDRDVPADLPDHQGGKSADTSSGTGVAPFLNLGYVGAVLVDNTHPAACGSCVPPVTVSCCGVPVAGILYAHVTNKTGDCSCIPDTFRVYNDGSSATWIVLDTPNGCDTFGCLYLECQSGTWSFSTDSCIVVPEPTPTVSCGPPLSIGFVGVTTDPLGPCTGTFDIEFTDVP